jgi:hypothetical protein
MCKQYQEILQEASLLLYPSSSHNASNVSPLRASVKFEPVTSYYIDIAPDKHKAFSGSNVVLTVQTFRNNMTGPSLYMFMRYYLTLGWRVIVYDRYGLHADVMSEFSSLPEVIYHGRTVFENLFPSSFNKDIAASQQVRNMFFIYIRCSGLR